MIFYKKQPEQIKLVTCKILSVQLRGSFHRLPDANCSLCAAFYLSCDTRRDGASSVLFAANEADGLYTAS